MKTYFAEATLHDDTGTLIATAMGVFKVQKPASV
jgi:acyl-coenzyme A thioesterase PaaI-like protein